MAGIRGHDTKPERVMRSALHRLGFRFRLQSRSIPGRPDIVLPRHHAVIFVHGCFWHGHDCHLFRLPGTRSEFWAGKIGGNRQRDDKVRAAVLERGWRHLVIWECAIRGQGQQAIDRIAAEAAGWLRSLELAGELRGTGRRGAH